MKNFKRVSALLMALVLVFGLMPALVLAEPSQSVPTVVTPAVGDSVLFAEQVTADAAWEGAGATLSDGTSKIVATWDATYLYLVYATKSGAVATINGEAATVTAGTTYDVAKIALEQVGFEPADYKSYFEVELTVDGVTWDGLVALRNDESMVAKNGFTGTSGFTDGALATAWNWVATDTALGTGMRVNYQAYLADGTTTAFYAGSTNGYVMDFNLDLTTMPVLSMDDTALAANNYRPLTTGLTFALYDPFSNGTSTDANGSPLTGAADRNHVFFNIVKNASGLKVLSRSADNKYLVTDLDDDLGTQIHVRTETVYADATKSGVTLKVFINDKLVLVSSDTRYTNTALGTTPSANRMGMLAMVNNYDSISDHSHAKNNIQAANITISDVVISEINDGVPEPIDPNAPVVGDNFIFAVKGEEADAVWEKANGQLAAGEKFGIGWYGTCLHIIYAKQGVDAFKVNGKDATVIKGDSYDIAVISYEDLGINVTAANVAYELKLEVNGKTWEGFVVLNDLGEADMKEGSDKGGVTKPAGEYVEYGPFLYSNEAAIEIVANEPVVMDWDVNVKELPTSCDPDEITSWRGGWHSGYDYSWVKGITFVLLDPFTADADAGVKTRWIPVSLIKDENGDLYVIYCEDNQFKNVKLEGVTLDAENGTDLHFRVELTYADVTNPAVALKCYVNDTFLFESANARNTKIDVGSTPLADCFGMALKGSNFDVKSNDSTHEAWASGKLVDAVEGGATVLENIEAIDFAMTNFTVRNLNAEFELPEDPAGGAPAPTGDTNEVALYAALLVTSILGMVALAIPTIRKKLF